MSQSERPQPLSEEEARQLAEHLAVLTKSGLPLSPALRAAAAEIPNRRLSLAMSTLTKEMEAGKSLDQVLAANPRLLPPHMQRLIETGVRSGNLPDVLVRLVDLDRTSADLRRSIRSAVAYPLLLVTLWLMLVAFLALYVMPDLGKVYHDFHTILPLPTVWLMKLSGDWPWRAFAFFLAAVPMIIVGLRVSLRPLGWQRLLTHIPLIGRTLLWRGVANWSRLLSLLVAAANSVARGDQAGGRWGIRADHVGARFPFDADGGIGPQAVRLLGEHSEFASFAGADCALGGRSRRIAGSA